MSSALLVKLLSKGMAVDEKEAWCRIAPLLTICSSPVSVVKGLSKLWPVPQFLLWAATGILKCLRWFVALSWKTGLCISC